MSTFLFLKEFFMEQKITKIENQVKNQERVSIFINGEFAFGIFKSTLLKFDLHSGKRLTPEAIDEILSEDEYKKCLGRALKYIAYQERTEYEVRKKLEGLDFLNITIEKVIDEVKDYNYLNDETYAENYIDSQIKKMGSYKIKYKLEKKGIDEKIINKFLNNYSYDFRYETALNIAKNKNKQYGDIAYNKRYNRLYGYLKRRGYNYSIIKTVVSEIMDAYERSNF